MAATQMLSDEFVQVCFLTSLVITGMVWFSGGGHEVLKGGSDPALISFRRVYLVAYFLSVLSDWLQGPYVYALYEAYGFSQHENAILFVFGFGSSMVFGTFVGSMADKLGRKTFSVLYCFLYLMSCLSKHFANFYVLLVGRILGGVATSLLFSSFESWLVCENTRRGFSSEALSQTFSMAMTGNSLMAILAGIVAQYAADFAPLTKAFPVSLFTNEDPDSVTSTLSSAAHVGGYCLPFDTASVILCVNMVLILSLWTENYGHTNTEGEHVPSTDSALGGAVSSLKEGLGIIFKDPSGILSVGLISALFEASMFIFVFMWTPTLTANRPDAGLSFGTMFSAYMCMCMLGSQIFARLSKAGVQVVDMCKWLLVIALVSHSTVAVLLIKEVDDTRFHFVAFLLFELSVGMYFPTLGTLKASFVPEDHRATVYSLFRAPLNFIVIASLVTHLSVSVAFSLTSGLLCVCLLLQRGLALHPQPKDKTSPRAEEASPQSEGTTGVQEMTETLSLNRRPKGAE